MDVENNSITPEERPTVQHTNEKQSNGLNLPGKERQTSRLLISETILLTVFALVSVAVKQMLRLDLNLPGHSYVVYLFFLVFGPCYVNKKGAALYLGIVAGVFAVIAGSRKGVLDVLRFVMPAFFLELTRYLPTLGHPLVNRVLEGVLAALAMHVVKSGLNLITGKPWEVVLIKFYPGLVTYPLIGIACGVCAYFMYGAVRQYKGLSRR
ncbi:hypothetical protein JCM12294_14110 [Desulfocicer niacini]